MRLAGKVLSHPKAYGFFGKMARIALRYMPRIAIYNGLNEWGKERELPETPQQSFKEWYQQNQAKHE